MLINREKAVASTVTQSNAVTAHGIRSPEEYRKFVNDKVVFAREYGLASVSVNDIHALAAPFSWKPHQRDVILWAVLGGRRAIFASFGMGKTAMQLEIVRLIIEREGKNGLIVCPLGVRQEFLRDAAEKMGIDVFFVRSDDDVRQRQSLHKGPKIYLTNYESVREGKISPSEFTATSLDESSILRSFGGTKTYREFMRLFENVKYRFVATATPDPNEYIELLAYSSYLGIMDVSQAKTRFFKRDSIHADRLTLHPHKEEEFWLWVSSWAIFLQKPSDLGYDDAGYSLPPLEVKLHEVAMEETGGGAERDGQSRMFRDAIGGISQTAREKRDSIEGRVTRMVEIVKGFSGVVSCVLPSQQRKVQEIQPEMASEKPQIFQGILPSTSRTLSSNGTSVLSSKQAKDKRTNCEVEGRESTKIQRILSKTESHPSGNGGAKKSRVVLEEQGTCARDKQAKQASTLRSDHRAIQCNIETSKEPLSNLHEDSQKSERRSLPQDWNGSGDYLQDVQCSVGTISGQSKNFSKSHQVPQFIVWCDLNDEQRRVEEELEKIHLSYSSLYGSEDLNEREINLDKWRDGRTTAFVSKAQMYGYGVNMQQCSIAIFIGIDFKFASFIQAIKRVHRFLQEKPVTIHLIYANSEKGILDILMKKWERYKNQTAKMAEIIRKYGLSHRGIMEQMQRSVKCKRMENGGQNWKMVRNDCVEEMPNVADNSVGLVLTSVPFCYDEQTEVLSGRGWLRFGELRYDDSIATVNPALLCFEWQNPTKIVWQEYEGEMLHFGNRIFDQLVTPGHSLFAARRGNEFGYDKLQRVRAEDISLDYTDSAGRIARAWRTCVIPPKPAGGCLPKTISIPSLPGEIKAGHGVELYWVESFDFMRLAGWYLSEGHADSFTSGRRGGRLSIAQVTSDKYRMEIARLFQRIGLPPSMHPRMITVWCRNLAYFLQQEFGHGSKNKKIPSWVKNMHPELLTVLRDTMMKGDGSGDRVYVSYSQQLRDDFQEVCIKTGWQACINGHHVATSHKQLYPEIRQKPKSVTYKGMIGCASVPNGLLIIRRNGKPCVSGNSTQYEYSPSFQDFGHTESNDHFWQQMDFLIPHLHRVLKPGRVAAIHVKDRIIPGGLTGLGFQTVYPFHADCIRHFTAHGFGYMGMKTIVTDVVRENNQTYRLGWTEQCKDGTKMGVGMPEYILLFRKPPTSNEKSYADEPVVKSKRRYSRGRWQIDAHGFTRSNGNRPLAPEDLDGVPHNVIFKMFRKWTSENIYDFEQHVKLAEALDESGKLPVTFMLLQPASWSPEVWTDIARMRTLNSLQAQKGKQGHLCPLQFDIANRTITQFSMEGEMVLDPFAGIGTVPMCAVEQGRRAIGIELCDSYWYDACSYIQAAERKMAVPSLFDMDAND